MEKQSINLSNITVTEYIKIFKIAFYRLFENTKYEDLKLCIVDKTITDLTMVDFIQYGEQFYEKYTEEFEPIKQQYVYIKQSLSNKKGDNLSEFMELNLYYKYGINSHKLIVDIPETAILLNSLIGDVNLNLKYNEDIKIHIRMSDIDSIIYDIKKVANEKGLSKYIIDNYHEYDFPSNETLLILCEKLREFAIENDIKSITKICDKIDILFEKYNQFYDIISKQIDNTPELDTTKFFNIIEPLESVFINDLMLEKLITKFKSK